MKSTVLLVDGKNALWRSADAHSDLSIKDEAGNSTLTGAMYGFLSILCRAQQELGGKAIVCWDADDGPEHRRKLFPEYKQRSYNAAAAVLSDPRAKMAAEIVKQQAPLMDILEVAGIPQIHSTGWEADDVIGTLAKRYAKAGEFVHILSGDRDMLQLVTPSVQLCRPQKAGIFKYETPEGVEAEWGVKVEQFVDLKALMGDGGDNIPGCVGIGRKTAAKILQVHGTLRAALAAARSRMWTLNARWRDLLVEHEETVLLSRKLSEINCAVPLAGRPPRQNPNELMTSLMKYKFKSLLFHGHHKTLLSMGLSE